MLILQTCTYMILIKSDGDTPLVLATQSGQKKAVYALILRGANLNQANKYVILFKNRVGDTAIIIAAVKGHTDIVDLLISSGANVDAVNM